MTASVPSSPARRTASSYKGPACPACNRDVDFESMRDGEQSCPHCHAAFEAFVFHPPQRSARVLQVSQTGPQGASSCANHPRNAAVANCERCGLFICSLCELDVDGGKYCPACFERLSSEGTLDGTKTKFRDYGQMSNAIALIGFFFSMFLGLPAGLASIYYGIKRLRNKTESTAPAWAVVLCMCIALAEIAIFLFIWGAFFVAKAHK